MNVLAKLRGGDRRSIGRANEVVAGVLRDPSLFGSVFHGLHSDNPLVRMRASDVIEKVSAKRPEWLQSGSPAVKNRSKNLLQRLLRTDIITDTQRPRRSRT